MVFFTLKKTKTTKNPHCHLGLPHAQATTSRPPQLHAQPVDLKPASKRSPSPTLVTVTNQKFLLLHISKPPLTRHRKNQTDPSFPSTNDQQSCCSSLTSRRPVTTFFTATNQLPRHTLFERHRSASVIIHTCSSTSSP